MLKDLEGVKHYCQKLNAGEMYSLLAAVLTSRSWDDITRSVDRGFDRSPALSDDPYVVDLYPL